jgi:hypothetical protein
VEATNQTDSTSQTEELAGGTELGKVWHFGGRIDDSGSL